MAGLADTKRDAVDYAPMLAACATGDRAALRMLYEREAPVLLGVAQRIVRRREIAEEVLQDAFVQVWRNASAYDPSLGSARAWIFAIVRNRALNSLRDERHVPVGDEALASLMVDAHAVAEPVARLAEGSALRRCLEVLDEKRRQSIVLAYVWGYSHGEIAGRLGVPLGTVKAWIRRSLAALKECLG